MLYLNPPFFVIDGISLMPDHADPLQWYYMPLAPHLTTVPDANTGKLLPSFQLLLMRDGSGDGDGGGNSPPQKPNLGFVNFDVNLGVDQARLDHIRGQLQARANLSDPPRLATVPVVDGSVKLMLLGKESEVAPAGQGHPPPPDGSDRFVVKISNAAKPSLYADEQASFSVELSQDGAVALSQAVEGAITPIGVVYSLDYIALRPAYTVTLHASWDRVQTQLDERFGYDGVFVSAEIDEMVDKLIEQRDIVLDATNFVPDGADAGTTVTDFDKAKAEVREMITSAFFTPSIDPTHPQPSTLDNVMGAANRISQLAVTGGASSLGCFTYKKTSYTRIDKKSLDVTMSERSAVRRSIWPQGHLAGVAGLVRDSGLPMDRFVTWVDLNSDFFKHRTVTLTPIAINTEANILSVKVDLTYGDDTHSVSFAPGATEKQTITWASVLDAQHNMVKNVEYQYSVEFADVPGMSRPRTLTTPKLSAMTDGIDIFPPDNIPYWIDPITIQAPLIPWDRWESVDIDLRYIDPGRQVTATYHASLTKDSKPTSWSRFRLDPERRTFEARLTYRGQPGRQDVAIDWHDVDDDQLRVANPFAKSRGVQVSVAVNWSMLKNVFVDLSYEDDRNGISFQQSMTFDPHHDDVQDFVVDLADPAARRVSYNVTFLYTNGRVLEVPSSATTSDRLFVTEDMRGTQIVVVRADDGSFASKGLDQIIVSLHYKGNSGDDIADEITLTEQDRVGTFEFPFTDEHHKAFSYSLLYRYSNGLKQPIGPVTVDTDYVAVPVK